MAELVNMPDESTGQVDEIEFKYSPFSGSSPEKTDGSHHIITTNHPYMVNIGLGAFTLDSLQEWFDKEDNQGVKRNQRFFDNYATARDILYGVSTVDQPHFSAWRSTERNYVEFKPIPSWTFSNIENDGSRRNYTYGNLPLAFFNNKRVNGYVGGGIPSVVPAATVDNFFSNIVEMNNYVRLLKDKHPDETITTVWTTPRRAAAEFIRDIKTSKNGEGLTWTVKNNFQFFKGYRNQGVIPKDVTFNLYLFDKNQPCSQGRKLALTDFVIVDSPKDIIGTEYSNGTRLDGEHKQKRPMKPPQSIVAAPLDVHYNEHTGKWESGSRQIIARIMEDIPAAQNISASSPDVASQYGLNTTDVLNKDNANYEHATVGKAMPIMMQNGNPMQWSPVYDQAEDLPRVNNNKKLVDVVNLAPRVWSSGSMVILNNIDGAWIPIEFGEGGAGAEPPSPAFDGFWDFTSLISNAKYYFEKDGTGERFSYDDYEKVFYKKYYGILGDNTQEDVTDFTPGANTDEGYLQITSWDFMGSKIGGNRANGNALAQTIFDLDVRGKPVGENGDGKRVRTKASAPFFGCVFPGGYKGESIYSTYKDTTRGINLFSYGTNVLNAPFFKPIDKTTDVFDNTLNIGQNNSDGYGGGSGMFATNSSNLLHLPADIATNASPEGVNGRPISDVRQIYQFIKPLATTASMQTNCFNYFDTQPVTYDSVTYNAPRRYSWMYQDVAGDSEFDPTLSAFDLEPKNKNIIEFRPLTREVYSCFEVINQVQHTNATSLNLSQEERGHFGVAAQENLITKGEPVLSTSVLQRTVAGGPTPIAITLNDGGRYTGDDTNLRFPYGYGDLQYNGYYTPTDGFYHPAPYPLTFQHGGTFHDGAGAVGIITAICTVTAPSKITFSTSTYVGVQTTGANEDPAHGGSQRPQDFGCTSLHARVFTAWPRELTVYDSRFFSVFHFNYGAGVTNFPWDWYLDGVKQDVNPPSTPVYGYPDGWYPVSRKITDVDIRVPTWKTPTSTTVGSGPDNTAISDTTPIFNNSAVRSPDDWLIPAGNTTGGRRRGKLLPMSSSDKYKGFKYRKPTITLAYPPVSHVVQPGGNPLNDASAYSIMIVNTGTGYTADDTFTITGATGKGTVLKPKTINAGGVITEFEYAVESNTSAYNHGDTLLGYDYLHTDFLDYNAPLDGTQKPSARITAVSAAGQDLDAYVVCGRVYDSPVLRDLGPDEVTDGSERLTASPTSQDGFVTQPILDDLKEQSIGTEGLSENDKFDIYFFFHNDVTHHGLEDQIYHRFFQSRVRTEILQE